MPNYQKNQQTRVLRKAEKREAVEATEHLLTSLEILVSLASPSGFGVYLGSINTSGGIKLRIYGPDGNAETYIGRTDDAIEALCEAFDALDAKHISRALISEAARRGLQKPAGRPGGAFTTEDLPPIGQEAQNASESRSKRRTA